MALKKLRSKSILYAITHSCPCVNHYVHQLPWATGDIHYKITVAYGNGYYSETTALPQAYLLRLDSITIAGLAVTTHGDMSLHQVVYRQKYSTYSNHRPVILLVQLMCRLHAVAFWSRDARCQEQQTGKNRSFEQTHSKSVVRSYR